MGEHDTYWKRPWQKYVCLVGGALQLLLLIGHLRDYRKIVSSGILGPEALAKYAAKTTMLTLLEGVCAVLLFSAVVIGAACRSRSSARKAEGWTLLGAALAWGIAGPQLPLWNAVACRWEWGIGLALLVLSGAWLLLKKAGNGRTDP